MKRCVRTILVVAVAIVATAGCKRDADAPAVREYQWPTMGTYGSLVVRGDNGDEAMAIARQAFEDVEAALSAFRSTSDVSRVNARTGSGEFVQTGFHFQAIMAMSRQCHDASGGAFNPAVGPLVEAWGFFRGGSKKEFPPSEASIADALALCDFAQAEVRADGAARLNHCGMRLDFGAIAKGYAVDVAFDRLLAAGFTNVIVNIGGNMRCGGTRLDGSHWKVAVRNPRGELDGNALGTLKLKDGLAVSTSGDYEQFFERDGRRYTHILDPRTGRPVGGMAQVTVVARTAAEADALSTACFVLGPEAGAELLEKRQAIGALFVTLDDAGARVAIPAGDFAEYFQEGR
ncbi:MAG: FAD:protein FMN transferase [Kiritimatiellia bacterium]